MLFLLLPKDVTKSGLKSGCSLHVPKSCLLNGFNDLVNRWYYYLWLVPPVSPLSCLSCTKDVIKCINTIIIRRMNTP